AVTTVIVAAHHHVAAQFWVYIKRHPASERCFVMGVQSQGKFVGEGNEFTEVYLDQAAPEIGAPTESGRISIFDPRVVSLGGIGVSVPRIIKLGNTQYEMVSALLPIWLHGVKDAAPFFIRKAIVLIDEVKAAVIVRG